MHSPLPLLFLSPQSRVWPPLMRTVTWEILVNSSEQLRPLQDGSWVVQCVFLGKRWLELLSYFQSKRFRVTTVTLIVM
jgi:hypothetical protein